MEFKETIGPVELKEYSTMVLEAMQNYNEAKRRQSMHARLWDEYFANGMANGLFAGKNEATRLGEAINQNIELWAKLGAFSDEAQDAEYKLKEVMVLDKWVERTIKMMEIIAMENRNYIININDPVVEQLDEKGYKEALKALMARRLGA